MHGINGYYKDRKYGSDIYTFECSKSRDIFRLTVGKPSVLERLRNVAVTLLGYITLCKINFGFFSKDGKVENYFTWSTKSTTIVYNKSGKLLLLDAEKLTTVQMKAYEKDAVFFGGSGYTLTENGVKSIRHADYSGDAHSKNPRTMIGQLKDGSIILVVVQGRTKGNLGMTADEQADYMLSIGCVDSANLDGGGSSEMVLVSADGKQTIVNAPTDGCERLIGSSLHVLRKKGVI